MKKILSLVLVIALVLGSFSFAFAATPADVVGEDYEEAVEVLMALGVVNGYPDGTYKPERVVTRAEMAKLLVEALGYGQLAGGTAPYSDTAGHWAAGSIGLASGIGLVQGYPDGTFKPDATVSFDEAVTMILRALGYTDESLRGAWPTNYKIKAIDLGLYDDTSAQTGGADRGNVAIMLFNALGMAQVEIKDGVASDVVKEDKVQRLIDKVGTKVEEAPITYANVFGTSKLKTVIDLEEYLYHTITYYKNRDGKVAYVSEVHTSEIELSDVTTTGAYAYEALDADDVVYSFTTTGADVLYNYSETAAAEVLVGADLVVIYNDLNDNGKFNSGEIVAVKAVERTSVTLVDEYRTTTFRLMADQGDIVQLPTMTVSNRLALDTDKLVVKGDVTSVADIKAEDVVEGYAALDGKLTLVVTRDSLQGVVTRVTTSSVTIGGSVVSQVDNVVVADDLTETLVVYFNAAGKVQFKDAPDSAPASYALLLASTAQEPGELGGVKLARVRLLLPNGNEVIYNVEEDLAGVTTTTTNALVKYTLNSDGEVDSLVATALGTPYAATYNKTSQYITVGGTSTFFDSNVVIFDSNEGDEDVLAASGLGSNISVAGIITNSAGTKILAIAVTSGGTPASDDVYAYIISRANVVDPDNSTKVAQEITAMVDGVQKVLYSVAGTTPIGANKVFAVLDINSDGRVTTNSTTHTIAVNDEVKVKSNYSLIVGDNTTAIDVSTDVVVYFVTLKADYSIDTVTLGTYSDVAVDSFVDVNIMGLTLNSDGEVTVIFVADESMPQ